MENACGKALRRSASWTHQYADSANSVVSDDDLVKPPLGLLWFGGPPHDDILPRHGHGPSPQVVGGLLYIEGPDALRAVDVYTGHVIWQRSLPDLGKFYDNTSHQPGANEIGSNYVSMEDGIYVVHDRSCLRLDPKTGETLGVFTLPPPDGTTENPYWGHISVYEDVLIATCKPLAIKDDDGETIVKRNAPYSSSSSILAVMDRFTGERLWARRAKQVFRHNTIVSGDGKLFCVDAISEANLALLERRGLEPEVPARLLALDIRSGEVAWETADGVFGTWLGYSVEHDILIEGSSKGRDRAKDEAKNKLVAYKAGSGDILWQSKKRYSGTPMLHDSIIYGEKGNAFDLLTGELIRRTHPMTRETIDWAYDRKHGCNTPIGGRHMLLFRSAAAGFNDLSTDGGTGNWGGFRSGCTSNLIPADGVLNAPDYTRTCTCSYQNQCSLAMVPMSDVEIWTYQRIPNPKDTIQNLSINLGAPGDWPTENGDIWFEYPIVGGASPKLGVKETRGTPRYYSHHSMLFEGEERQVAASGVQGEVKYEVDLKTETDTKYRLRLVFAEPEKNPGGARIFDVIAQGETLLSNFNVSEAAGKPRRAVSREFDVTVAAGGKLVIELAPTANTTLPPVLSGWELTKDGGLAVN